MDVRPVRFFALHRVNHMLHRLCGPRQFIWRVLTFAAVLGRSQRVSSGSHASRAQPPSRHRLRRGLGYPNPVAPHAFAPERQSLSRGPPSPPVFLIRSLRISPLHGILPPLQDSSLPVSMQFPEVEPGDFTSNDRPPACALRPVIPINACTLIITAAAGTGGFGASCG